MFNITFNDITAYLFVFVRMVGMVSLNPIFSRKNIPAKVRMVLAFCLTLILAPNVDVSHIASLNAFAVIGALFLEFAIGAVCGLVFQVFYYMLFVAGDILDVEFGLSMAKVFDPGTNIQMSITSNLFNVVFMLYLFVTDSHLILIKLFAASYDIVPAGMVSITTQPASFYIELFRSVFSLVFHLALPFIVALFVTEVAMGVLMKLVPQIHVFVISIQIKIIMGLILLFLFAVPVTNFLDRYITVLFESIEKVLYTLT